MSQRISHLNDINFQILSNENGNIKILPSYFTRIFIILKKIEYFKGIHKSIV